MYKQTAVLKAFYTASDVAVEQMNIHVIKWKYFLKQNSLCTNTGVWVELFLQRSMSF